MEVLKHVILSVSETLAVLFGRYAAETKGIWRMQAGEFSVSCAGKVLSRNLGVARPSLYI